MARRYKKNRRDSDCDSLHSLSPFRPMEYGPVPIETSGDYEDCIFDKNSKTSIRSSLRLNLYNWPYNVESDVYDIGRMFKI